MDLLIAVGDQISRLQGDELLDNLKGLDAMYGHKRKIVLAYLALQYSFSEVCESLVIVDRWMFLHEQGFKAKVVPIFDVEVSPRNLAIFASK